MSENSIKENEIMGEIVNLFQTQKFTLDESITAIKTIFLNCLMNAEAETQSATLIEKTGDPTMGYRNGYKPRKLKTKDGELELKKPQLRNASFTTVVFDRYSRVEKALGNIVRESYILGVSTDKVTKLIKSLGINDFSKSTVSNLAKELDTEIQFFLERPITDEIPYVFIDATYIKIRNGGRYINQAVFVAYGINSCGYRVILGAKIAMNESETFWDEFFDDLIKRGLSGVKMVISDGHGSIKAAVEKKFLGCSWQMCIVHLKRAVLNTVSKKMRPTVAEILAPITQNEEEYQKAIQELENLNLTKAADVLRRYESGACNFLAFPQKHQRRIYTTNGMERVNREIKRRVNAVGTFPNEESAMRLICSILMDIDENWTTGIKYLDMEQ